MTDLSQTAVGRLAAFPRWWGRELAALLPGSLRRLFGGQPRWLLLDIDDGQVVLSRGRDGRRLREVGRIERAHDPAQFETELVRLIKKRLSKHHLALRLPVDWALRKRLTLPLAVEEDLHQVLTFEMERQTPFRAEDVYFTYDVTARNRDTGKIAVDLTVLPRQRVQEFLAIAEKAAAPVAVVEIRQEGGAIIGAHNLLPRADRYEYAPSFGFLNWLLLALAAMLMASLIYLTFDRQSQVLSLLAARADTARQAAQAVPMLRQKMAAIALDAAFLHQRKASLTSRVLLLDEISRLLPDHTWLTLLELKDRELKLTGFSKSSSEVLRLVEASPRFSGARFLSPVTQDARRNAEKFSITANLTKGPG